MKAVSALTVVSAVVAGRGLPMFAERSRRKCSETLLPQLEASGATMLYVESRQARSNKLDQETVLICRRKRLISHHMHVEFLPGSAEPLLWIPDIVCGAALAAQRSETSYLEQLADRVMTIDVDGR